MKKALLITTLCLTAWSISAQSAKQKLAFIPYTDASSDEYKHRKMAYDYLYEAAIRIFINTQRFDVLDRSKFDILRIEKNVTKGEDFINSEIVEQGKALAAEVLAVAKVTALSVTQSEDGKSWRVFFTMELKQIDVATSKALSAIQLKGELHDEIIKIAGRMIENPMKATSPEQAISIVVSNMEKDLDKWIQKNFPIKMKILTKRDTDQILIARGGQDIGLTIKDKMCLRRVYNLDSYQIAETVAELKFTKADGVGGYTTKFEPKNKKEWEKIVQALNDFPEEEIFIMECISLGPW